MILNDSIWKFKKDQTNELKNNQASSDQTMLDIMGEVTTKLNPQLNIPYRGSKLGSN